MKTTRLRNLASFLALLSLASGCAATRPADPARCALVGAAIGGLAGVPVGVSVVDDDDDTTEGASIGAGAGAALGALTGFTACALMPERVAEAEPEPEPVVRPAPVVRKTTVLPGVHFAFDRAELLPAARETLDREVVPELRADPEMTVVIEGHTDSVGTDAYNQVLSERRADAVRQYLVLQGIEASRIATRGYGESQPIADNSTPRGRAENRRVEIKHMR